MTHLLQRMAERGRIDQAALEDGLAEIADFRFARPGQPITRPAVGGYSPLSWTTNLDESASFDDTDDAPVHASDEGSEGDDPDSW